MKTREPKLLFSMADCFCFEKVRWELLTNRAHLPEYDLIFTTPEWKRCTSVRLHVLVGNTGVWTNVAGQTYHFNNNQMLLLAEFLIMQDACVDAVISIAVLHHISSKERRMQLLTEMARIMKPGAKGLVTVWASQQENQKKLAKWQPLSQADTTLDGKAFCQACHAQEVWRLSWTMSAAHSSLLPAS